MSNDLVIPEYMKEMMATADVPKTDDMVSGGMSVPRISLKGSMFRFKEGGDELEKTRDPLDCIIVGITPEHGTAKTFYEGAYNPESSDPPNCSSTDGVRPDGWVSNPVSRECLTCPNNKFGSAISMSGKKSKACRDSRRLYVVRAKELKEEKPKVWLLNVTVSSLKALTMYSRDLAKQGVTSPAFVISRISFDEESEFPKINFAALGVLSEDMAKRSADIAKEKEWDMPVSNVSAAISQDKKRDIQALTVDEEPPLQTDQDVVESTASADVDAILSDW